MGKQDIEAQRRRKAAPPTGRAEAPRRETGGSQGGGGFPSSSGGGFQRPTGGGLPTRGKQIGGCGTILLIILFVAFQLLSNGGLGGGDVTTYEDPFVEQPQGQDSFPAPVSNFTPPVAASGSGQTWTIMLYQDADDKILEKDIFVDLNEAERVGSSDRVRIVAQIDRHAGAFSGDGNWTGTRRYYVTQDNDLNTINSRMVQDLGEANMGDGQSLVEFVQWSVQNFPADKYVLILSDHGMGWPGGWSDPSHQRSGSSRVPMVSRLGNNIYLMELDEALRRSREAAGIDKFEMVGMDACLMAQLEVMAALQPHARYAVASEETEPSLGWAYASFLGDLVQNPDMDGARLSRLIVSSYINDDQRITDPAARADFLQGGSPLGGLFGSQTSSAAQVIAQMEKNITISAIDLEKLPALMQSMNDFAYALQDEDQRLVAEARNYTQSYTSIFGREVPPSYIDLGHFAVLLANNTSNARVKGAATQLVGSLQDAVIAERHGSGKKGSTGLAIYFPNSTLYSSPLTGPQSYTAIANRFASESLWDDFLAFHYIDLGFQPQTREPVIPSAGSPVRAPGQGNISVSQITASSRFAAPNQPVRLSVDVTGENVGYIYLFVGYYDAAANSIAVLDTDFLESPDTREVNGVYYPVWGNDFTLSFNWDPTVFAINDGQTRATALFTPQTYGATSDDAAYTVDGIYTFTSGGSVDARLYFQNGSLVQVFGITGEGDTGAPREITLTRGDTFTLLEKWIDNPGGTPQIVYENGETFTFGAEPFRWEQLYAAAGDYVVGFIITDLDGNQYPVYTQITVQ